ncbi:hypothetical protein KAF25_001034 [Fusarium avenaceum]|uniref:Uncharacterized protein n=1 Tax=Fusarium avenaceum TaxID=40199 RepID=A0A9P7H7C0_9HYPO|nr:hypothetical protein KAF25_001034 [Fusarium avenaceum]
MHLSLVLSPYFTSQQFHNNSMPTYLCHGFRWHRRDIRIFVILNDLEDAAPNWLLAPATSYCVLDQLHAKYDFLPELSPPTTPTQASVSIVKNGQIEQKFDHVDDDHALPSLRVHETDDVVLMHSWSPVRLLEEYDVDDMATACRPYAYVADHAVRIDLSVDVAGQMAKYYEKMAGDDGWIVKLRDELQKGEPVRWYIVVCGDEVREVPGKSDEEEKEVGYEQIRDAAQTWVRTRRGRGILEGFSDSPSESPSEYDEASSGKEDQDDALTILEDILDGSDGASTPRPLSRELPDFDIPLQPQPDPSRASVLTASTVWSQDGSSGAATRRETPDIDAPLLPSKSDPNRASIYTASSAWSRKESFDDGLGLGTPDVELPLLQSENTRYSTSTASGLYSEYGERKAEPRDFIREQPLVPSSIKEVPDIIQPLKPEELVASKSLTPPTPKPLKRQLPAPELYDPGEFIPPFSPDLERETFRDIMALIIRITPRIFWIETAVTVNTDSTEHRRCSSPGAKQNKRSEKSGFKPAKKYSKKYSSAKDFSTRNSRLHFEKPPRKPNDTAIYTKVPGISYTKKRAKTHTTFEVASTART